MSEHIAQSAEQYHGAAGRAFIRRLSDDLEQAKRQANERMIAFMETVPELSGQARRVAKRFALAAAALELAAPVTGLAAGVGMAGVKQCFDEWLETNGAGKHEDRRIIEQAAAFMDVYALSMRFSDWNSQTVNQNHAGYRKQEGHITEYWLVPVVFEEEICQNFDKLKVCEVLHAEQWLKKPNNGRWQHQRKYNGASARFYVLMGEAPPDIDQ